MNLDFLKEKNDFIDSFKILIDSILEGIIIYDENRYCIRVNSVAPKLLGYTAEEMIGIRGDITSIYIDNEGSTINVEGKKEEDTKYSKAIVNINKDTVIQNKTNDKLYNINDLELGMTVEVIFNEGVMESDPVKGTAKVIKFINE